MRSLVLGAVALSLIASPAQAAPDPQISSDRIRADLTFLADDLLEGREAGTRGYDLAARYVATRFAALGLEPAVDGQWYQMVPFELRRLAAPAASMTIGGKSFANFGDVLIGPSAADVRQTVSAPVVFAGYGLSSPERGIDDYAGLDVRGKYVALLSGFPKGMASDIGAHLASEKAKAAEARGAIGTLSILTPTSFTVASWDQRKSYSDGPNYLWLDKEGKPYREAPNIRSGGVLNIPAQRALFAGAPRSLDDVLAEAGREGGNPKGFELKPVVRITRSTAGTRVDSPNVIGLLPGSDPALRNEYVLVMGHLDHDGIDPTLTGDKIYNGAMDNAAGIATMLEAARALASGPRPKRSIMFAAVTAEEKGLLGAQYLAKHPVVGNGRVVGVVNLDMPILTYDFKSLIAFGAEHSTLGKLVEQAAAKGGVTLTPDPAPAQGFFTRSDHYNFVKEGIPAVFLATGESANGTKEANEFIARHYHKVSDDLNLPIDWNAAAKFARINYLITQDIANAPEAPRWYSNSFFGTTFARDAAKAQP